MRNITVSGQLCLLEDTAEVLEAIEPGAIVWYWYIDQGLHDLPSLLLVDQRSSPTADEFLSRVASIADALRGPGHGARSAGVVEFPPHAPPRFLAMGEDGAFGRRFAGVISRAAPMVPQLLRLLGFHHGTPSRAPGPLPDFTWPSVLPAGALPAMTAAASLAAGKVGDRWRFAFLANGPEGEPALILDRAMANRDVSHFEDLCARVVAPAHQSPKWLLGDLELERRGAVLRVASSSSAPLTSLARWIHKWSPQFPTLQRLAPARMELSDGTVVAKDALWSTAAVPMRPRLAVLAALGEALTRPPPKAYRFLFTPRASDGTPVLVVAAIREKAEFNAHAKGLLGDGAPLVKPITGMARLAQRGGLAFRGTTDEPRFLPALASFVANGVPIEPRLRALANASYQEQGPEGPVGPVRQDPSLWESLR